jgi:hypothetical protein
LRLLLDVVILFGKLFHVDLAEKILVLVNSCIVVA